MSRQDALGEFEQAVLLAIVRLGEHAYGVTIRREIEARLRRSVAVGALYTALDRLERKGLIRSTSSEPLPQRGGRSRRQIEITAAGVTARPQALHGVVRASGSPCVGCRAAPALPPPPS
jgi:DNA-binding PadR family transcriptional regulator